MKPIQTMASKNLIQKQSEREVQLANFKILNTTPQKGQELSVSILKVYRAGLGLTRQNRSAIMVAMNLSLPTDWLSKASENLQKYLGTS